MPRQGPRPGSKLSVAELQSQGPRLHRYPNGTYVIQYVGLNKRKRNAALAKKIGAISPEMAEQYLETFKVRYAANGNGNAHVPAVLTVKHVRRAAESEPSHRPRDPTKAVLGLIATHLLNTMAHTVKLLQEADE